MQSNIHIRKSIEIDLNMSIVPNNLENRAARTRRSDLSGGKWAKISEYARSGAADSLLKVIAQLLDQIECFLRGLKFIRLRDVVSAAAVTELYIVVGVSLGYRRGIVLTFGPEGCSSWRRGAQCCSRYNGLGVKPRMQSSSSSLLLHCFTYGQFEL